MLFPGRLDKSDDVVQYEIVDCLEWCHKVSLLLSVYCTIARGGVG